MKIKEEHKDLKKKVNIAEEKRNTKRGTKSWHDLRTLKKLKLNMKDKLLKSKQGCGSFTGPQGQDIGNLTPLEII